MPKQESSPFDSNGEVTFKQHCKNFFWLFLVPVVVIGTAYYVVVH